VARSQLCDLGGLTIKERFGANYQRARSQIGCSGKGSVNLVERACRQNFNGDAKLRLSPSRFARQHFGIRIGGVNQCGYQSGVWHDLVHNLNALRYKSEGQIEYSSNIASRPIETGDKTGTNWVYTQLKDNRYARSRLFGRSRCRKWHRSNDRDVSANEVVGQSWKPIIVAVSPAVFDDYILSFDETRFN
jgi:hypothetical protein